MAELETPPRWLDGDTDLPRELLEGLRGCAQDAPSSAQQARMQENLLRGVASAAPAASGVLVKLVVSAIVVGCAAGALWWWREARAPAPKPRHRSAEPAGEQVTLAPAPGELAPATDAGREASAPSGSDGPADGAGAPSRSPAASARAQPERPRGAKAPARVDAAAELALLTRARRALGSAPERTLELAAEHARTYGDGSFGQERELLAIEALVKLERTNEARRRGARFIARYPRSAHRPRLDVLVGPH